MKLLQRLVNRINEHGPFVFLTPCISVIGNCSEEIQFGLLRARREGKRLVIAYPFELPWKFRFPVTNREIFDVVSPHRAEMPTPLFWGARLALTALYGPLRALTLVLGKLLGQWAHLPGRFTHPCLGATTLWKPDEEPAEFRWEVVDRYRWPEQLRTPLAVGLRPEKRALAHATRLTMGIPEGAWFVGLHVRERGFYNDREEYTCRNGTIANFIPAIREITRRGGWVVRLGDKSMTPLPPMQNVIDYPHSRFKSDLMDIYLISECRYYVGMCSGILDAAWLFQKPMVLTNMTTWTFAFPRRPGDLGLIKHIYSKSRGRCLSIQELFETSWETQHFWDLGADYEMLENTPEEILGAVNELLDNEGRPHHTELQKECMRRRIKQGRRLLSAPFWPTHYDDMHNRYRVASRLESSLGTLAQGYLEANWDQDTHRPDKSTPAPMDSGRTR